MLRPLELARRQLERDRRATAAFPHLLARKVGRMRVSAHGFLRGSAPLFYEILRTRPELARGPGGEGWLVGDLHVENFGAYRPTPFGRDDPVAFGLNDFDDAIGGAWRFDMLRLATSVLLATREAGVDGTRARTLCAALLEGWCANRLPRLPRPIQGLLDKVRHRTRRELLANRTEIVRGKRRFIRGERYRDLAPALAAAARNAFAGYVRTLGPLAAPDRFDIVDLAFRVAGTGSLGSLRIAVLVAGRGGPSGHWIFDLKEERAPSAQGFLRVPQGDPAARVLDAMHACLSRPPIMAGRARLGARSMLVRRLAPQEDKLDLTLVDRADLAPLAEYLGAIVGTAHRRAGRLAASWNARARSELLDAAVELAGLHEATYLAYCGLRL